MKIINTNSSKKKWIEFIIIWLVGIVLISDILSILLGSVLGIIGTLVGSFIGFYITIKFLKPKI